MFCMPRRLVINHHEKEICCKTRTSVQNNKLHLSNFKLLSAVNLNFQNDLRRFSLVSNSIKKILKSSYTDVHTNLAIEDWIFKNSDEEEEILLMWKNDPCVVIGIAILVIPETMIKQTHIFIPINTA